MDRPVDAVSAGAVRAEDLERAVWDHVRDLLGDPDRLFAQFQEFAAEAGRAAARGSGAERKLRHAWMGCARGPASARRLSDGGDQPGGVAGSGASNWPISVTPSTIRSSSAAALRTARQGPGGADGPNSVLSTGSRTGWTRLRPPTSRRSCNSSSSASSFTTAAWRSAMSFPCTALHREVSRPPSPMVDCVRIVHFMRNALAHAGKSGRRVVAAFIATAFAQDDAEAAGAVAPSRRPDPPKGPQARGPAG